MKTSLLSPAIRLSLGSHQVSNCLVCLRVDEVVFGRRWLARAIMLTSSLVALCHPTIISSRTSSMTTGCPRSWWMKCWRWRGTPFGAVSQRSRLPQLPPQLTCRLTVRFFCQQLLDLTHRWWTEREDPDIDINGVHHLAAAVYIRIKVHSTRYPDLVPFQLPDTSPFLDRPSCGYCFLARHQPLNAPLLHSARTVHEVIAEEYRILE